MIVQMHRWVDKQVLMHSDGRAALHTAGVHVKTDLTTKQREQIRKANEEGKIGFFKNGRLVTRERRSRQNGQKTTLMSTLVQQTRRSKTVVVQ